MYFGARNAPFGGSSQDSSVHSEASNATGAVSARSTRSPSAKP